MATQKKSSRITVRIVQASYNVSEDELEGPGRVLTDAIAADELLFLERLPANATTALRFLVVTRRTN